MRRSLSNRLFLCLLALLTFYTAWSIFHPRPEDGREPAEVRAYREAVQKSKPMIENTQLCTSSKIELILVIISSHSHFLERQSIRETWGSVSNAFGIHSQRLFVIGYPPEGGAFKDVTNEAQSEQDLLYLTVDDYSSTLKELHAYRWLEKRCGNVTFTFKSEDDLFVNSFLLHELVNELKTDTDRFQNRYLYNSSLDTLFLAHINPDAHTFLFGWAFQPGKPERNLSMAPYYVSHKEYSKDLYPRYCSGFGYLMDAKTRDLITAEGFKDTSPFRFSDIYVTGMLPERMNFICDALPFTYNQGTTEQCINLLKQNNRKGKQALTPPVIVCSTGRHVAQNTFSDYYRIWTVLKYVHGDGAQTTRATEPEN